MSSYGLGELPGISVGEAADVIQGETGHLLHLPQLPARGLGADMIGRSIGLLDAINVDRGARTWVMSPRPGRLSHLTRDFLSIDLDTCEDTWGTSLERVKIQVVGPWSLGARIEMSNGHRVITDHGAVRDLTEALILGIHNHVAEVARRFRAQVEVQIDEPDLPVIVAGKLEGTSTFDTIRAINVSDINERLSTIFDAVHGAGIENTYLNLTDQQPLWGVIRGAGAHTVQVSLDRVKGNEQLDGFGEAITNGTRIGLGITGPGDHVDELLKRPRERAVQVARFFDKIGLDRSLLVSEVDVHPRSALVDGTLAEAANAYRMARIVADMLAADSGDL